jgi:hypothetical protein
MRERIAVLCLMFRFTGLRSADMTGVWGLLEPGEMGAVRGESMRPRVLVKLYEYGIATLLVNRDRKF